MKTTSKKTVTFISALALTSALSTTHANAASKVVKDAERAATFSTAAIVGGVAGGPVGFILGALGGAYLAEKSKTADIEMEAANTNIEQLEQKIDSQQYEVANLEKRIAKKLEFQVMFPTGGDEISFQDNQRITSLAGYLKENPELHVRLDGHADPRGTDEYNNVLSAERAKSVATALAEQGIDENRIEVHSHGSDFAISAMPNRDQHAMQRRVKIEVYNKDHEQVASTN